MSDSIKVAIKVRPLIKRERDDNLPIQWAVQGNSIVSTDPEMKKRGDGGFCFDHIFDMNTSNSNIFDIIVKPIVNAAVNGFNGTVFAYGQTSSGKTYTMMGTMEEPGIIPLAVEHMFDAIANTAGREFLLRVSYLEIYNERVNDLLNKTGIDLKLKEDGSGQVVVQCKEEITNSPENVLAIMKKGDKNRRIGETNMNERSSRSHTIFRITIESREAGSNSDGAIQVSQLNLVDLAGSERARQTGATGERFKEGRHINMSLSTLGLVIMQLSESQDGQKHVNFRDSKLTRLLQTSLGGNAMTAIICAVTPAALEETQCTLSFACRAKSVKNKPQVNEVMSDAALLKRYAKQLSKLQEELQRVKNENRSAEMEEMESKLQEKDRINQLLEERIELLKTRIVSGDITNQGESFKHKSKRRQTWGGPGMFNQHLPIFQPKTGLPTIKEVSFEKPERKSMIQSLEIMNQTFQTEFTDFELELFESERARDGSDSEEEPFITKRKQRVTFQDDVFTIKFKNSSFETTPEKCNTSTQTASYQVSPSTPKQILRQRITDLTKEFVELREFTTLEKQLICQENHCLAREEAQILPEIQNQLKHNGLKEAECISEVKKRFTDLAEEKDVNRIIIELCLKLKEAEEQSSLKTKQCAELEKQMANIASERNEFEYISRELRTELKKKTMELELKNMSEETIKQLEMTKMAELKKQIESMASEKSLLERDNSELKAELSKKTTELRKQTENIASERNEFEHIRRELHKELNKRSLELERLKRGSGIASTTEDKPAELEKEIESIKSERDQFERISAELESKVNLEIIEKQTAVEKVFELEKQHIELKAVLDEKITDLESKLLSEQTSNQEMANRVSELEKQIEQVTLEKKELEETNSELNKNVAELQSTIASQQTALQQTTERISELEREIESTVLEKNKVESVSAELRSELNQKISELEAKATLQEIESQRMVELEKQIEGLILENRELETNKVLQETETQETIAKIAKLEEEIESVKSRNNELEDVATELRTELNAKLSEEAENQKAVEKISEFESQIANAMSEKNQLECTVSELRTELDQKISELEANKLLQETETQETIAKISKLEEQIESTTSEKNELERKVTELQTELNARITSEEGKSHKISDFEKQISNVMSEKNELKYVNNELRAKLSEKISKIKKKSALEKVKDEELMEMICELEKEIENITFMRDELERVNIDLHTELDQITSELESKIISEQNAMETISELNKQIETIMLERNELEHRSNQLNTELQITNAEALEKISNLKKQIEDITAGKNESVIDIKEPGSISEYDSSKNLKDCVKDLEESLTKAQAENQELRDQLNNQSMMSCSRVNDSYGDISNLIVNIEAEKSELEETLQVKCRELEDIKNDVRSLKDDIKNLQDTIYLLTTENMEMATKLTTKEENAKQVELELQKTIDELYGRISDVTSEKINLESDLATLKDQLESLRSKMSEAQNEEQLFATYQSKIDKLTAENIELSTCIAEKNKELQSIKESKSLLYDHECIYKEKMAVLAENNKCLRVENDELSTDLIDKIEENDTLKEQCNILKNKTEQLLAMNANFTENGLEHLEAENNTLKAEIAELKAKITILSDENAKFSNNLLETIEDFDSSCREKSCNNTLHLSTIFRDDMEVCEDACTVSQTEDHESLKNKVAVLQNKIDHLTCLNKKLSDLKLVSCSQCAHLRNLNESRRALKLEAKALNQKLNDLQRKFDRKCADAEVLKQKINQDLSISESNISLNASFVNEMDVMFIEEKIQSLNEELQTLRTDHDKLSILYEDKCNELKKLQSGIIENVNTNGNSVSKKDSNRNENKMGQIQSYIDQLKDEVDEMKKNSMNFTATLNQFKAEKADLLDEISNLKELNEELQQKVASNESAATNKVQILEHELNNISREIEQYSAREKEFESQRLTLEVELENLKVEEQNKNALIAQLNERVSCLTNELDLMRSQKSDSNIISDKEEELERVKKEHEDLQKELIRNKELEQHTALKIKEMEVYINNLQANIMNQESLYSELQKRTFYLEQLLQENEQAKHMLMQKLQAAEIEVTDYKNNLEMKYKNEFDSITLQYQQRLKESENNLQQLNDTLNKYVGENLKLTEELGNLQGIKQKYNEMLNEKEQALSDRNSNNEKLKDELDGIKICMLKELKSLKCNIDPANVSDKSINEIFIILLQTLVSKEEEVIKSIRDACEREKRKLEEEKQQCVDTEKRTVTWAKELEVEIEKLHSDIMERERLQKECQNKISQLEYLLKESTHEKEMLKEKVEALETDFSNLQTEFDKQCKIDSQQEEAILVAQKREKEVQKTFQYKEMELQTKLKTEKDTYEKRINELVYTVESYKSKILELNSNIEGLEANEKQLKNIIEANSIEIKRNNQSVDKINAELEQVTLAYNRLNQEMDQKNSHIEEITAILKNKCDDLSEYKTKVQTIVPKYEMLQRHKEELEMMRKEKEEQLEIIKDKLNSEEIKSDGLSKQLNELNNKNISFMKELDELKEKYEELQEVNAKLERKIRNSTSKIKAEAEIEELKELNRRLQNNLEGASNRVVELQEAKNQTLKELTDLKVQYEFTVQENAEMKTTLTLYKSKYSPSSSTIDESKYDALLLEKNKIALELEDKKLILNRKEEELTRYVNQIQQLTQENKELDNELDEYAATIQERDTEISKLEAKLYEAEQKFKCLNEENKNLRDQIEAFKNKTQMDFEMDIEPQNDKQMEIKNSKDSALKYQLKSSNKISQNNLDGTCNRITEADEKNQVLKKLEAQKLLLNQKDSELLEYIHKIQDLTKKLETSLRLHSAESSKVNALKEKLESYKMENKKLKTEIEELEMKVRISTHNEGITMRKDSTKQRLQSVADKSFSEQKDKYQQLKDKIRELELQIVSKNGKIATLEIQIQSENFPYQRKCKELEERVLAFRNKNAELNSEIRKLQRTLNDVNAWECDICRRWRVNRKDQGCQTIPNNTIRFCSSNSGVVEDHVKMQKLLKEREVMKNVCRSRLREIKELEDRIKKLEQTGSSVSKVN